MSSITGIAQSGLIAQSQRLAGSASNVANVRSRGAIPNADGTTPAGQQQVYQPVDTVQTSVSLNGEPAGTRASYKPTNPAYNREYAPDESFADSQGFVAAPNVDLATERVSQISAAAAYKANAAVVRTEDEMLKSLYNAKV